MTMPVGAGLSGLDIERGLHGLGLRPGDLVEVHSSLSSLGWVEGGGETVVRALMDVVGQQGGLVMPAFPFSRNLPLTEDETSRGMTLKIRILDPSSAERTGMGAIADAFRGWPGVVCGQTRFRVCAWGPDAEALSQGFGPLLDRDGLGLLIGVDIHRLSSMHHGEGQVGLPAEVTRLTELHDEADERDAATCYITHHGKTPDDAWAKVWDKARARGLITEGRIGQATCYLFRAAEVVGVYKEMLRADPYGLYGVKRDP